MTNKAASFGDQSALSRNSRIRDWLHAAGRGTFGSRGTSGGGARCCTGVTSADASAGSLPAGSSPAGCADGGAGVDATAAPGSADGPAPPAASLAGCTAASASAGRGCAVSAAGAGWLGRTETALALGWLPAAAAAAGWLAGPGLAGSVLCRFFTRQPPPLTALLAAGLGTAAQDGLVACVFSVWTYNE